MWANNEVGTVNPIRELAAVAHEYGVPIHTDAVQAVGILPVDFAASGVDALTLTGHKLGGPYGAGALLLGREVPVTPLLHGGLQERDVRSGTLDTPAVVGLATAVELAVEQAPQRAAAIGGLRDDLVGKILATVPDAVLNGDPGTGRHRRRPVAAARQRPPVLPRLRGRLAAHAARRARHRVLHRLGVHRGRRPAQPRAARDGRRRGDGARRRCGSPSATPPRRPTSSGSRP